MKKKLQKLVLTLRKLDMNDLTHNILNRFQTQKVQILKM